MLAGAFGKRIMELLQHDGSERSLVIFGLSASVGRPEIQQNRDILEYIIDANDDIILKDLVPIRKAIITIDKGNWCEKAKLWKISRTSTPGPQQAWARHEAEKLKLIFAYFLRLASCGRWSHDVHTLFLKERFFARAPEPWQWQSRSSQTIQSPTKATRWCKPKALKHGRPRTIQSPTRWCKWKALKHGRSLIIQSRDPTVSLHLV